MSELKRELEEVLQAVEVTPEQMRRLQLQKRIADLEAELKETKKQLRFETKDLTQTEVMYVEMKEKVKSLESLLALEQERGVALREALRKVKRHSNDFPTTPLLSTGFIDEALTHSGKGIMERLDIYEQALKHIKGGGMTTMMMTSIAAHALDRAQADGGKEDK